LATAIGGNRLSSGGELTEEISANGEDWFGRVIDQSISLDDVEAGLMRTAMNRSGQNISQAARLLGLTRPALAYRLKKLDPSLSAK
ncbi:TPA: helix-turn-helix domain-containing protein, partial [Pseudomonas aeruginosa]|nr:helix-turn-helix domain-containing protein [Pseudomonas aeruginosa]